MGPVTGSWGCSVASATGTCVLQCAPRWRGLLCTGTMQEEVLRWCGWALQLGLISSLPSLWWCQCCGGSLAEPHVRQPKAVEWVWTHHQGMWYQHEGRWLSLSWQGSSEGRGCSEVSPGASRKPHHGGEGVCEGFPLSWAHFSYLPSVAYIWLHTPLVII